MTDKNVLEQVLADAALCNTIIEHRRNWIRLKDVSYDILLPKTVAFVPTEDLIETFRQDYNKTLAIMIYSTAPGFDKNNSRAQRNK
ncbi:MAG: hypothetical protein QM594_22775 [Niabella sp.]